jgi:AcrR family transcriptional regulator
MDEVAREAQISRQGLYFLFRSKGELFRHAAERGIELDLFAAEKALADSGRSVSDRIVDAFDCWAGRYVGPMQDTETLIKENPTLLGPIARNGPAKFEALLIAALKQTASPAKPSIVARTLVSLSIGIKHQAADRDEYRSRMADAVRLLIPPTKDIGAQPVI